MAVATDDFATWLEQADIPPQRLPPAVQAVLHAVFRFRQQQGFDYFSTRLLSHFLLHCDSGLKVACVARLLGISRPTASTQQGLSSKQVIQQAHHRLDGRPYGKLLPRFAGPIAGFLVAHPDATRAALLDFIDRTFGVRVSRIAVYKFLKKYGLDHIAVPAQAQPAEAAPAPGWVPSPPSPAPASASAPPPPSAVSAPPILMPDPSLAPVPPFSSGGRSMPVPSC
jgi:transposase